jgi:branched-chain amino acid transport system substrate-binding protein
MKKFGLITGILLSILLVCSFAAVAADNIVIGVHEPMTGPIAAGGQMTMEGVNLAFEQTPTVLGKPIKMVLVDNKGEKVEAANAIARLIEFEKVIAIVGSYGSTVTIAGGEVSNRAGIPMVGCSPTNPLCTLGKPYVFRACFIDPFQGAVMANFAIGDQDFTAQLSFAAGKNPDVIFIPGASYGDVAIMIIQAREMGIDAMFLGGDTWEAPEFLEVGGKAIEGSYFSTHFDATAITTKAAEKFNKDFMDKYGKQPSAFAALGFDAYNMVIDAIKRANSSDPKAIRDAIAETEGFEGVTGIITLDENGDAIKDAVIKKVEDGKFKYVTTVHPVK